MHLEFIDFDKIGLSDEEDSLEITAKLMLGGVEFKRKDGKVHVRYADLQKVVAVLLD